ncbi:MAG: magnesium transporter [Desulfobacteraceae bacterium]|nr:magnesium transporter [Desulfobacteraceae bacterium]
MTVMTQVINEKLIEDVKGSIREKDREFLMKLTDEMRPADLADLIEHLDTDERLFVFKLFEPEGAGEILVEIESPVQEHILDTLDNKAISEIVEELDSDDAADLVGDLPEERAKEIIKAVEDDV